MKNLFKQHFSWAFVPFLFFFPIITKAQSQVSTQQIRGRVIDKQSQAPLPGAVIRVSNTNPVIGASTNSLGEFVIKQVPVGRLGILVTNMGYKELALTDLVLNAGKELYLNIELEEQMNTMNEVVITGNNEKNKPLNAMSVVSTRTFSVEETQKFAAAVNDPARMATSFAGVVGGDGGNNFISIRGNSPNALLWRMEGVDIPNPNHFAAAGTAGGGISIISAQLLANSDFSTGAFAPEYGNALGGVFDLKLRKGNNQKREYTFQAGLLGIDLAAEGPFAANYGGSYLINYRYSTLGLISNLGIPIGDATTLFQDLSWNIILPTQKAGNFSFFGFAGLSNQQNMAKKDTNLWKEEPYFRYQGNYVSNTGAFGFQHNYQLSKSAYIKNTLMLSGYVNEDKGGLLSFNYEYVEPVSRNRYQEQKITLSTVFNKKFNAANQLRVGTIVTRNGYSLLQMSRVDSLNTLIKEIEANGNAWQLQSYAQLNHKVNSRLSIVGGLHSFLFTTSQTLTLEPRVAMRYEINSRNLITLGYGLHSQLNPIGVYFVANENGLYPNEKLKPAMANHYVVGHTLQINRYTHLKTEIYLQRLFQVPVSTDINNTYAIVNSTGGFASMALNNEGKGINKGIELSLEQFTYKNAYYLLTVSLFDSKYKASNGQWYHTQFNTNYAINLTAGKEWKIKGKKDRFLGANLKLSSNGGFRYTPIDLEASKEQGETIRNMNETYARQNPGFLRLDTRVSLKTNYKKTTGTLALDLQNATNHKNVGGNYYNETTGEINYWYMTPLIPVLSYRLEF